MHKSTNLCPCCAMNTPLSPDDFNQRSLEIIRRARGAVRVRRIANFQPPYAVGVFALLVTTEMADAMQENSAIC